jgi:hypothetical protein
MTGQLHISTDTTSSYASGASQISDSVVHLQASESGRLLSLTIGKVALTVKQVHLLAPITFTLAPWTTFAATSKL